MEVPPNQLAYFFGSVAFALGAVWLAIQIWQALKTHPEPAATYATKQALEHIDKRVSTEMQTIRTAAQLAADRNEAMIKTEIRRIHDDLTDFKKHYAEQADKRREAVDAKLELIRQEGAKQHEAQQQTLMELTKSVASLQTETAMIYRQLQQHADQVAKNIQQTTP